MLRSLRTTGLALVFGLLSLGAWWAAPHQQQSLEPFRGVTTDGTARSGLFPVRATGVSTAPVMHAAEAFLGELTAAQHAATVFPADHDEWRMWHNVHRAERAGVSFEEMNEAQRERAFDLLRASLSAAGFAKSRAVMRLNHHLGELVDRIGEYGEWLYWITIMGDQSGTEPWGWQLDGHHLDINYFVLGDQVVMTPTFMGSEPVRAESGPFAGTAVMQEEQEKGYAFMRSLSPAQQRTAIVDSAKGRRNALSQAFRDNLVLAYAGIRADALTETQRDHLLDVVAEFVGNMDSGHAAVKMDEVRDHLDETHFAWIGAVGPESAFYYRVHSPVILIEFDHQAPVALEGREATREHVHSVVRTPNGNDYGKDLLRQHYERHSHDADHGQGG